MIAENHIPKLSLHEFRLYQKLFYNRLGIFLPDVKLTLVASRLWKRLGVYRISSYADYYTLICAPENRQELELVLEIMTTNETFFFRDPSQFDYLRDEIIPKYRTQPKLRVWSAACSTGEEAYSLAMLLESKKPGGWELLGSDINHSVLEKSRRAIYLDQRTEHLPTEYRRRFCRRGTGPFDTYLRITPELRSRVLFQKIALHEDHPSVGPFDIIFLRNVMIYFDLPTRRNVIERVLKKLQPGGYLFVGLSESLRGLHEDLRQIRPGIHVYGDL